MALSRRNRLLLVVAGVACLIAGAFPHFSGYSEYSLSMTGCTFSSRAEVRLGLACSPVYRSMTVVSETGRDGGAVSRHNESSTSRVEFLSWSAALVAVGAVLLLAALVSRARPDEPSAPVQS